MAKQSRSQKLIKSSLIAERYENISFENVQITGNPEFKTAFARYKKYCEISHEALRNDYGIYLFGDTGTGKPHLTGLHKSRAHKKLHTTLFTNFFEISQSLKETFKNGSKSSLLATISSVDFYF